MYVSDFEFDGQRLSSFGWTCITWNGEPQEASPVSNIAFSAIRPMNKHTWKHYSSQFSEPLSTRTQIAVYDCMSGSLLELKPEQLSPVMRWISRRDGYQTFRLLDQEGYDDLLFYVQINATPILHLGRVYGLDLTLTANKPFAVRKCSRIFQVTEPNGTYEIGDLSDDVGDTPINMQVTCDSDGDLYIKNNRLPEREKIQISNVLSGDVIVLDGDNLICTCSPDDTLRPLSARFNFRYPKLINTYENQSNVFEFSLPCSVHVTWESPVKVGI